MRLKYNKYLVDLTHYYVPAQSTSGVMYIGYITQETMQNYADKRNRSFYIKLRKFYLILCKRSSSSEFFGT